MKNLMMTLILLTYLQAQARTLSWEECLTLAQDHNAELKQALAKLESLQLQEGVVKSEFLPSLSAQLGVSRERDLGTGSIFSPQGAPSSVPRSSFSLKGSWNLFAGFADQEKLQEAQARTSVEKAGLQVIKAKVSYELKAGFQGLLYAMSYRKLTQEIIRRRQENLRMVELRYESGRENKGSVFLSRAYLQQAKYDDLQAQNALNVAKAEMAKTLGLDEFPYDDFVGAIPLQDPQGQDPDFRRLVLHGPDFLQKAHQEEAALAAMKVARSPFYPSLDMSASMDQRGRRAFPDDNNSWTVQLGLTLPFFNGGKDYYQLQSSAASWASARSAQEQAKRQLAAKMEETYRAYQESIERLKMSESFLQAALVRSEIARKKYNNGLLDFDDWDVIENDLISRQKLLLQGRRDRVIAEAAWEQVQGKGIIP